jgi:AraC-like DNA-binding protein
VHAQELQRLHHFKHTDRAPANLQRRQRSLQRHLREEGKSFRAALDEFRREMSTHLMDQRKLAVYEVAFLLGYADPGSFHRAFRRWHRKSPRAYRRAS